MSSRLVWLCMLVLAIPVLSQPQAPQNQQWVWGRAKTISPDSLPQLDTEAIRRETIHHDVQELSALSVTLQSDLQQLQRGMLPKDLAHDLKRVEKLSKKLRQEMAP